MAHTFRQIKANSATTATSLQVVLDSNQTSGDLNTVEIIYSSGGARTFTVTDTLGSTYTRITTHPTPEAGYRHFFYAMNVGAGANTITITADSTCAVIHGVVRCDGGLATSSALQAAIGVNAQSNPGATADTLTSGNIAATSAPAVLIASSVNLVGGGGPSVGTGMTSRGVFIDVGSGGIWRFADKALANTSSTAALFTADSDPSSTYATHGIVYGEAAGGGSSTTVTPAPAALTMNGRAPSANAFTNVRIREVLINEAGSPVGNRTGMSLLIWYGGSPVGAPDLSYSALTTDANGTTSWSIATGSLAYNQSIFYVATDGGASLSMYTCARMVPSYE
jgi:hypothetical protein